MGGSGLLVRRMLIVIALAACALLPRPAMTQEEAGATLRIGFLGLAVAQTPPEPYLDAPPADEGVAGARLGIDDDNTTGRFLKQHFALEEKIVPEGGDVTAAFRQLVGDGIRIITTDLPAKALLAVADLPEAKGLTILNAGAPDDELRAQQCRANVLHTLPSRAMLADALLEYLVAKQWRHILLATGPTDGDRAYAAAIKRAITKFNARLVADKPWTYKPGARRSDTGHYAISAEVARFTEGYSYDVLVVADEDDEFGDYIAYSTYDPRPVAGTHGLIPTAWARPHQEWGATQLQDRFLRKTRRWMTAHDYAAWLAVRAAGEAATRTQSVDPVKLAAYMRGDKFELAGYKGLALSFRPWDGQMRQAILLADSRALVSVSPQPEFLHQFSPLDTLGIDRPESQCHFR
jgi:ABC transporter substrate binding protein (PQQ-dependent alcohol dehydrogenase system)